MFLQAIYFAGYGGEDHSNVVKNILNRLMTPRCARLFSWTGSKFTDNDIRDKIPPVLPDGNMCEFKSSFQEFTGLQDVVYRTAKLNKAYKKDVVNTTDKVKKAIQLFFNRSAENDSQSTVSKNKRANRTGDTASSSPKVPRLSPRKCL